jgi:hypothetical protein
LSAWYSCTRLASSSRSWAITIARATSAYGPAAVVQRRRLQRDQQVAGVLVQLGGVDQVLLQVRVQPQHPLGHRGRPQPGEELERTRGGLDHPRRQPVPARARSASSGRPRSRAAARARRPAGPANAS